MARDSPDSPLTSPKDSSYFLIFNHEFSCAPDLKIQKLSRAYVQELFWEFQFTYVRARKFFFFLSFNNKPYNHTAKVQNI